MADEAKPKSRLEIAHVLFMDIVGYSRLLNDEQREALHELNTLVLQTDAAQEAQAAGQLIRLPTGDGMALVFTSSVEAPVECAFQVSQSLRAQPNLPLRMGIHSGPVQHLEDVNGHTNVAGAGINMAQRVMDCGDAGHILVSKRVADDLAGSRHWQPYLHELGDCEVKHGVTVSLVNLYADVIGNPVPPSRFGRARRLRRRPAPGGGPSPVISRRWLGAGALLVLAGLAFAGRHWGAARHRADPDPAASSGQPSLAAPSAEAPEKSIAVLPFESLSADKDNAYFAEGIQDEILTDLARVADLKVISRTSVLAFRAGGARNLREIGRALGVSHLLEGSVQRQAGKVRVTAQLIDARTDLHLWAEHYDGDLADIFAIQSQMAEQIVGSLKARLSPDEKKAIDTRPTTDLGAYDLYLRAKELLYGFQAEKDSREPLLQAVRLLDSALEQDPRFALAHCLAARAHDQIYWLRSDHSTTRLAQEEAAVANALRLQPDLGEAHLARAMLLYHGSLDYAGASEELAIARRALPNSAEVLMVSSYIDRRQGRWPVVVRNQEKAVSLDPRNPNYPNDLTATYDVMRMYREENRAADVAITVVPQQADFFRLLKAQVCLEVGQPEACRRGLATLPADYDADGGATTTRFALALGERHFEAAARVLAASPRGTFPNFSGTQEPREWLEALAARAVGDPEKAKTSMLAARRVVEEAARGQPEDPATLSLLGRIDAALGRKEEALREGRRAVALRPVSMDAMGGPEWEGALALIYAWTGETDLALGLLGPLSTLPGGPHYGELRLNPAWDGLRGNPRFERLVAAMEPR